jgi:hypothetical protein
MTNEVKTLLKKIVNVPNEVVDDFMNWASEDFEENFESNIDEYMIDFDIGDHDEDDIEFVYDQLKSDFNYENVKSSLIEFLMYSLEEDDEYLDEFIKTGWEGFGLFGSISGQQLLSIIHKRWEN